MTKKRRFGISQSLNQGFSETISAAENNMGSVRFEVIALSRLEADPENPRDLVLTIEDLKQGTYKTDKDKQVEYERLLSLAETIRRKGVMNPIVVYKYGDKYRLVAGERRFLASIIAGKEDIQARILAAKPQPLDLRLLQWIENTEREDLSLKERMGNVRAIVNEYNKERGKVELSATLLKELMGISLPQASCYMSVLQAPEDIIESIDLGKINNLDKAAYIAKIKSVDMRQKALNACIDGASLKRLRDLTEKKYAMVSSCEITIKTNKKQGRVPQRVNMGITHKPEVIKKIVHLVTQQAEYNNYATHFEGIDWADYAHVTQAFRKLISILEKEVGNRYGY